MFRRMFTMAAITIAITLWVATAQAGFVEFEPNDTIATATPLDITPIGSDVGFLTLGPSSGDVDFFAIALSESDILTAITTPLGDVPDGFGIPDTAIGVFDGLGTLLLFNDDAGDDSGDADEYGSAIRFLAPETAIFFIGITGYDDPDFLGSSSEVGDYALTVSVVPEPATMVLLASCSLLVLRRRRR